jgi:type VI secretion system secreted protein VgrG
MSTLSSVLGIALADDTRLYRLEGSDLLMQAGLLVEAWHMADELSNLWELQLSALSPNARIAFRDLAGQQITLITRLADGSELRRSGLITRVKRSGGDGGFCRYIFTVHPWLFMLGKCQREQYWVGQTTVEIIEGLLARYARVAAWRWADDVLDHLLRSPFSEAVDAPSDGTTQGQRRFTSQNRVTDRALFERLLTEEGLGYRFEQDDAAPMGHRLVIFADSANAASCPEDITSASELGGAGIRFHRASGIEVQDAIQALGRHLTTMPDLTTVASWHELDKRTVAGTARTDWLSLSGVAPKAGRRPSESYEFQGAGIYATQAQADRHALLLQQGHECRWERWFGRSSVRTFSTGLHFAITQSTIGAVHEAGFRRIEPELDKRSFVITRLYHLGINNLPKEASDKIAAHMGSGLGAFLPKGGAHGEVDPDLLKQVQATGYGNTFSLLRRPRPWRPFLKDEQGKRRIHNWAPTQGVHLATVVGPDAQITPNGADEIYTDQYGRIRVAFDAQLEGSGMLAHAAPNAARLTPWVRVVQDLAGPGMGTQFTPRIGQRVLITFQNSHPDRPIVAKVLYTGRGEGGIAPTPGGQAAKNQQHTKAATTEVFGLSNDHTPSGQGNLIGTAPGGSSPAWHGAAPTELAQGGQRNAAALSGYKSKEFGGLGFNQMVFDDSNRQLRIQLATTQHHTQLNMGHLIHQADNHRGSFRGEGFELRTDAYGSVRAKMGLSISTYGLGSNSTHSGSPEPAGDNAPGMALAKQMSTLASTLSNAAKTHQTVQLAGHIGTDAAGQSTLSDTQAPLQALHTALSGMVMGDAHQGGFEQAQTDAGNKNTTPTSGTVPHPTDPMISITAKAGLGLTAGQDIQVAANESINLASGEDTNIVSGGTARIHTGQAIGVLAGSIKPGDQAAGKGISLIAAQGDVEMQAQSGPMELAAKGLVNIMSANSHIDWAAAKRIVLATAGGANVVMEGGNIKFECPGTITVMAGAKSFTGPQKTNWSFPPMPRTICIACLKKALMSAPAFTRME